MGTRIKIGECLAISVPCRSPICREAVGWSQARYMAGACAIYCACEVSRLCTGIPQTCIYTRPTLFHSVIPFPIRLHCIPSAAAQPANQRSTDSPADRLINAKDHASIQIQVADVDADGKAIKNKSTTIAICGRIRAQGDSDDSINRIATQAGREFFFLFFSNTPFSSSVCQLDTKPLFGTWRARDNWSGRMYAD